MSTNQCITCGTKEQEDKLNKALISLKKNGGTVMSALQKAQEIYGYVPKEVQMAVANGLEVPLEEVYGVATFYSQFSLKPKGKYQIGVCLGTACYVKGSGDIADEFKKQLGIENGDCTEDGKFSFDLTRCIGCCGLAPVITVNSDVYGKISTKDVAGIIAKYN